MELIYIKMLKKLSGKSIDIAYKLNKILLMKEAVYNCK